MKGPSQFFGSDNSLADRAAAELMVNRLRELADGLDDLRRPNGSIKAPSRSCADLFDCFEEKEDGLFLRQGKYIIEIS